MLERSHLRLRVSKSLLGLFKLLDRQVKLLFQCFNCGIQLAVLGYNVEEFKGVWPIGGWGDRSLAMRVVGLVGGRADTVVRDHLVNECGEG